MMLSFMSSTTVTGCKNFLTLIVIGSSNTPKEFILDLLAPTHPVPWCNRLGHFRKNACRKLFAFMQVIAAPVSYSQVNVLSPVVTLILGWVLFPHQKESLFQKVYWTSPWRWHRDSISTEEWPGELDVGVASSSSLKILEGEIQGFHGVGRLVIN